MDLRHRLLYPFARRFFAGTTLDDALRRARRVNNFGIGATIDFLGEDVTDADEAGAAAAGYARAIEAISRGGLDASVAVKLTHIGLAISPELASNHALSLADDALRLGVPIWLDMEGSAHTDDTIRIYRKVMGRADAGIALQACLKRTWDDLRALVPDGAKVRLVKGAYNEPPEIALQGSAGIRDAYTAMTKWLFENARSFAVGTHDRGLVRRALTLSEGSAGNVEFQMLMGVRDDLKRSLAKKGKRVVEYIPFGQDWYGYGIRRLKEKRRNILYFAQGMFGR